MTTLSLVNVETKKSEVRIYRTAQKLDNALTGIERDTKANKFYLVERNEETNEVTRFEIVGVGYDQNDEGIPYLIRVGLVDRENIR